MNEILNGPKFFVTSGGIWENLYNVLNLKNFAISFRGKYKGKVLFK